MSGQILMIMQKEWLDIKTTLFSTGSPSLGLLPILFISSAVSVYEPIKMGPAWLQSPVMLFLLVLLVPITVIGFISPDSFVKERQQGTLEPLLATPASDRAILFGKISIAGLYGCGVMLANMVLGLVTLNVIFAQSRLLFYSVDMALIVIVLGFLFSFLLAIGGVNSSLYATTLREAQNGLGKPLFLPMMFVALVMSPYMPGWWQAAVAQTVATLGSLSLFLILAIFLLAVDGMVLAVTVARFQRKRLMT